jgi:hypothetical protein
MSVDDYNRIVGLDAHNERERRYDETAAAQSKDLVQAGNV